MLKDLSFSDLAFLLDQFQNNLRENSKFIEMRTKDPETGEPILTADQQRNLDIINYSSTGANAVLLEIGTRIQAIFGPAPGGIQQIPEHASTH